MKITAQHVSIKLARPFSISRGTRTHQDVVRVTIDYEENTVVGECTPYARYGESVDSVMEQIQQFASSLQVIEPHSNVDVIKQLLQDRMPAGAARNGIDSALWRLTALHANSQFPSPHFDVSPQIETAMTVSVSSPSAMAEQAKGYVQLGATLLKVKLDGEQIIERVAAVRSAAPNAKLILDANEAWLGLPLQQLFHQLTEYQVAMIEQPVPKGEDECLRHIEHPIPLCADESCHVSEDLPSLLGCYEMINIKLDKTGGLTEALELEKQARQHGLTIMVGCMLGTSIAMKAALPIATRAEIVDLDGPVLLGVEEPDGLKYQSGQILVPQS
ncbi:dipeptide epimerase [Vibrio sp. ZSDE26]|uniref:Dipeptide epimerase n=1 Tax=Vibrio amylolyticus TaxID=2847292 RepID=A0A9X1XLB9_9VIBR|nr:N-acetyl-D-Glu racemase DgcA [Vibrio amylolyticus]MCK6262975.1 dipeptide epimerase [Vibrio amylolyticus]